MCDASVLTRRTLRNTCPHGPRRRGPRSSGPLPSPGRAFHPESISLTVKNAPGEPKDGHTGSWNGSEGSEIACPAGFTRLEERRRGPKRGPKSLGERPERQQAATHSGKQQQSAIRNSKQQQITLSITQGRIETHPEDGSTEAPKQPTSSSETSWLRSF